MPGTVRAIGVAAALALLASDAIAADPDENRFALPSISVTGSNIPSVERQTALPVQVITRDEIEKTNLETAAQLVNTISAATSYSAFNESQGFGNSAAGFSGGALRGLGYQFTLVLLNGRRIANFASVTRGGDLNSIPLSAVERVEILKDGASAIYGSDAIAGVINFVLRDEYQGFEVAAQYTSPEHTGGYAKRVTAWAGLGDLATQGVNGYLNIDYQKFGGIAARDRAFAARSYIPDEGLDRTETASFPANVKTPDGPRNPTGTPGDGYRNPLCAAPLSSPTENKPNQCNWFGDGSNGLVAPSELLHLVGAFTWKIDADNQFFLNASYSHNEFTFTQAPTSVSNALFLLPATSPFYPRDFARAFNLDGTALDVSWRAQELGPQTIAPTAEQLNAVGGMRGRALGWNYNGALNYSRSEVDTRYTGGFARASVLLPILNSGIVDPFGPNTPDVIARMSTAKVDDVLQTATSTFASFDFVAWKDVANLPAGPLDVSAGFNVIRERLETAVDPALASRDILNAGASPSFSGSRDVLAAFAETRIPMGTTLDANVAVRYDQYSDFGGTINPKASLRWQAWSQLVMRGSVGTGFLAPSLTGLYAPKGYSLTTNSHDDSARCPYTRSPQDCNRKFPTQFGGNSALQPATSTQWSFGGLWAPAQGLSLGADYVSILVDDRINFFTDDDIWGGCPDGVTGPLCHLIHRGAVDHPGLPGPIEQVDQFLTNLGKKRVSAIDFNADYRSPAQSWGQLSVNFTGTYNIEYLEQQIDGSYRDLVGKYSTSGGNPGVIPRWRHYLVVGWSRGPWSITVTENYQTGTYDQNPAGQGRRMGDYDIWGIAARYGGFRDWTLSAGVSNLFDRDPPFSNQSRNMQVGYDPTYADPHGRMYWAAIKYTFH